MSSGLQGQNNTVADLKVKLRLLAEEEENMLTYQNELTSQIKLVCKWSNSYACYTHYCIYNLVYIYCYLPYIKKRNYS